MGSETAGEAGAEVGTASARATAPAAATVTRGNFILPPGKGREWDLDDTCIAGGGQPPQCAPGIAHPLHLGPAVRAMPRRASCERS